MMQRHIGETDSTVIEKQKGDTVHIKTLILLIGLGLVYCLPLFLISGIPHYPTEDTFFHLNRLIGLENVWTSPVCFHAFEGTGSLVNIFYPWLLMYPMWILYKMCGSYVLAYKLYYLIVSIATIFSAYYAVHIMTRSKFSSICFAILYAFSAYRFADVFRRQALGEVIALSVLPIVVLGVYYIVFNNYEKWHVLSLGMTLLAYSHLLSVFMTSLMIALIIILSINKIKERKERFLSMMLAICATCLMSAGALIPIIRYYNKDIFRPRGSGELAESTAYSLLQIIKSSIRNEPTAHGVGLLVIIAIAIGVPMMIALGKRSSENATYLVAKTFMLSGLIILIGTSSIAPWYFLGEHTLLGNIQFVWRLNAYSSLLCLMAFSMLLSYVNMKDQQKRMIVCLFIILSVCLHITALHNLYNDEEHRITEKEIRSSLIIYHAPYFDYAPTTAFQYYIEKGYTLDKYYLDDNQFQPDKLVVSEDGSELRIEIANASKRQALDIPVFYNEALEVKVNGVRMPTRMSDRGTVLITLPKERGSTIVAKYRYDTIIIIGWILSLITTVAVELMNYRKIEVLI